LSDETMTKCAPLAAVRSRTVALVDERRHAQRLGCLERRIDLGVELRRRSLALRLVGGVEVVAEAAVEVPVKRHRDVRRPLVGQVLGEKGREAVDRVHRPPLAVDDRLRDGEEGAEQIRAGVDQMDGRRHARL